jgi:hypothetical protein
MTFGGDSDAGVVNLAQSLSLFLSFFYLAEAFATLLALVFQWAEAYN